MLITIRDKKGKLRVKDVLDMDFDMEVDRRGSSAKPEYYVKINHEYELNENFLTENDAETAMINLANARNQLEDEIRGSL